MSTILDLPPGLHANVPSALYHARVPGLVSKGALDLLHRSPAHLRSWLDGAPDEDTPALSFGRAFHCALLEPDRFAESYAAERDFGDCRKKENKSERDAWRAANAGKEFVSADDATRIRGMVGAVHSHPLAGKMIRDGEAELTVRWADPETGLPCKSRADYYVRKLGMVADVKSTMDASHDAFRRDVAKYRYHVQDALYRAGFAAVGAPVSHFVFIVVEKDPPHAVAIYSLDANGVGTGYRAAREGIDRMAQCVRTNTWPGYPEAIQTLELPPWAA